MSEAANSKLLHQLAELKNKVGPREAKKILSLLKRLDRRTISDISSLVLFHEILLFLCAYPQTAAMAHRAESQLRRFSQRIAKLLDQGVGLAELEHPEVSGIAGTSVTDTFTYDIVRWLLHRHASQVQLSWDWFEDENRLADAWPRFMPLLEEDTFVEAHVPYKEWLQSAAGQRRPLSWLLQRFDKIPVSVEHRAELYNAQQLYTCWTPSDAVSRSGLRGPRRIRFYHRTPLISRRDVQLKEELRRKPPRFERLTRAQGEAVLDKAREASTIRYRELYGFTHGDPNFVYRVDVGRGVDFFLVGLPAGRRLPLRAYHCVMIFKNEVPIAYFEGLSLFDRMESGFNLYYTFRDGETAWLYAQTLNVMRHLAGVSVFSLDPYQIGHENEEGIQSGAFWFYRKLGFRSTNRSLRELTAKEEEKMRARERYRTPAATLRKLAAAPMVLELDATNIAAWDAFQIRSIGIAVQRQMRLEFGGDPVRMRERATRAVCRILGLTTLPVNRHGRALSDFAVALYLIRKDLERWSDSEKRAVGEIIKAKSGTTEVRYLRLIRQHSKLRAAFIKLGSTK